MTSRHWAIWILVIALGCRAAVAQEGYAIQGNRIVSQGADQWRPMDFSLWHGRYRLRGR